MTLGLYDYDRRYRRRFWIGLVKVVLFIVFVLGVGLFAYQMGVERYEQRDAKMRQEVADLTKERDKLELLARQFKQAQLNAETRVQELETRLARETPQGELAVIMRHVAQRMADGVSGDRLACVGSQARHGDQAVSPVYANFPIPRQCGQLRQRVDHRHR